MDRTNVRLPVVGHGTTAVESKGLKPSRYNIFAERGEIVWAFNSRTTAFARLTRPEFALVQRLLQTPWSAEGTHENEMLASLAHGQFLVPSALDELELLKVKNRLTRFSRRGPGLVIAPTLRCNFACEYCYVDLNANKMSSDNRERVKRFFDRKLGREAGSAICWTGGDPSLALDVVQELSSHFIRSCSEVGAHYDAVMITNGYLLDARMVDTVEECQIHSLQVTLDGSREAHNKRRFLANGRPTYDVILDNIAAACKRVRINLRINIDRHNRDTVDEIFNDLRDRGIADRLHFYLANLEAVNEHCGEYGDRTLTHQEFADIQPALLRKAASYGMKPSANVLKLVRGEFCGANSSNYFVIDANAKLLKCYNDLGTADVNGIGYIDETGTEVIDKDANLLRWLGWDPFEVDECRSCAVLPLCMGGCSYARVRHGAGAELGCLTLRYNIDEIVNLFGEQMSNSRVGEFTSECASGACAKA